MTTYCGDRVPTCVKCRTSMGVDPNKAGVPEGWISAGGYEKCVDWTCPSCSGTKARLAPGTGRAVGSGYVEAPDLVGQVNELAPRLKKLAEVGLDASRLLDALHADLVQHLAEAHVAEPQPGEPYVRGERRRAWLDRNLVNSDLALIARSFEVAAERITDENDTPADRRAALHRASAHVQLAFAELLSLPIQNEPEVAR